MGSLSPEQEQAVDSLTRGIINKILHEPMTQLKSVAQHPDSLRVVDIVRKVFNLK